MSEAITMFEFHGNDVRVVDKDGNPWFVASDIAKALDISQHAIKIAVSKLKEDHAHLIEFEDKRYRIVSESGLYKILLRSQATKAEEFQDWITEEVLPSLRKDGFYATKGMTELEMLQVMINKAVEQEREAKRQKAALKAVEDRVDRIEYQQQAAIEESLDVEYSDEAPKQKTLRAKLNQLVRSYAVSNNMSFQDVWNQIYTDHKYRYNVDIKRRAQNKGERPLDIADQLGKMGELFSVASNLFKNAN